MRYPRAVRRRPLAVLLVVAVLFGMFVAPSLGLANIEEQRARLPPPATDCEDPVEGVWLSHSYYPQHEWYMFTLRVRRTAPGSSDLTGEIEAHAWNSEPNEPEPPACRPGLDHWVVFMTARGHLDPDGTIHFGGTTWRVKDTFCGYPPGAGMYNLDQFSGKIDPAILEFQSVNNDGGEAVNEPTVFRRIGCLEPLPTPHPVVRPPPFFPSMRTGGCGK